MKPSGLVVFRRDLPGGRIVILSLDDRQGDVVGRLQIERRADAARREGEPPVVAEVRGASRESVLAELRRIAESEGELAHRLDEWQQARRAGEESQALPPPAGDARRVRMPDDAWWAVERRHEMTQLRSARGTSDVRRLFLFFRGPDGALRRAEVPGGFPPAAEADESVLRDAWQRAEVLQRDGRAGAGPVSAAAVPQEE